MTLTFQRCISYISYIESLITNLTAKVKTTTTTTAAATTTTTDSDSL